MDIDRSALPDLVEVEMALLDFDLDDFDFVDFVDALLLFLPFTPLMMATAKTVAMSFMIVLLQSLLRCGKFGGCSQKRKGVMSKPEPGACCLR